MLSIVLLISIDVFYFVFNHEFIYTYVYIYIYIYVFSCFLVEVNLPFQFDIFFMTKWTYLPSCPQQLQKVHAKVDLVISSVKSVKK